MNKLSYGKCILLNKAFMILISSVYLAILGYCHRAKGAEINY